MLSTGGRMVSVVSLCGDHPGVAPHGPEQRSGVGEQQWSDGSRYEGEFAHGLKHGRGKYTWKNGECYEGSFYRDFRHGDGVYWWPSGHKFIGKFYLNRKEGYGQHLFSDGSHFQGLYHRDQRFGPGVLTYPNGHQDVGLWHNERLLRLCTTLEGDFTLKDFPEYAAYLNDSTAAEEYVPLSTLSQKYAKMNQILDDRYILPPGIEYFSTDGDHLPLPPGRRKELDQHFFGEKWEPDINPYQGYRRDPLSALPLEARMQAHVHNHRLQSKNLSWDVDAVLALKRTGFGPKGPLELRSELLIHLASRGEHKAVAHIVHTGLVHPDVADALKYTALMAAAVNCCDDVIDVLLDMGVDIDKLNGENMSALAMCHVLYYPFHSLHITESHNALNERPKLVKSEEPCESASVDGPQETDDRPDSMETVQTHSHVFSEEAEEEPVEDVSLRREVSCESELVIEQRTEPIEPPVENESELKTMTEEIQEQQSQEQIQEHETDISEAEEEEVDTQEVQSDGEETEDNTASDLKERHQEEGKSEDVVGVGRSIEVMDGNIVVGSVQWKEYPAKGKIRGADEAPSFDSTDSVNSFQIHVTEEALHCSAEALSCTGVTLSLDTEETVRKMAAMKIEHRERLKTLKLLLDRGADPNACRIPMPVLFLAVMASDDEAVRRLLLSGARTDIPLPPERKGLYPLHVAASLPGPAGPKITELLLHAITDPDARACDQDEIYKLDQETSDPVSAAVDTKNREGGTTALHVACQRDYDYQNASKIVTLLLSHGARTDLLWSGHSPLSLAIASGNEMAVEELLNSGADPNVPLGNGVGSALCALANNYYHSCGNRQKLLDMLVKGGADILMPVLVDNEEGSAVDYAYYSWNQDTNISTTPYHALNIQDREIYKERQQLLKTMAEILRQTFLRRETERQQDAYETDRESSPFSKFCFHCSRATSVSLKRCSRCQTVFYCSKECKRKSWNEGHKDECIRILVARSPLLQTPKPSSQRRTKEEETAHAAQKNDFKSPGGAKGALKSKTIPKALGVMYKPKITKFMKLDMNPRSMKVTETAVEDKPKENYSYI